MIKFSTHSTMKLSHFLKMFPIWLPPVCFPVYAAVEICLLTLYQGNHEANCDNGNPNVNICVPGQLNFTGYRAHWKYVDTVLNFTPPSMNHICVKHMLTRIQYARCGVRRP